MDIDFDLWRLELKLAKLIEDRRVRSCVLALCCSPLLAGCSYLGYYKIRRAERAPPGEAEKVSFPTSYEKATQLDGPAMAALEVARNEFMPPGVKAEAHNEEMARCLERRDVYDVSVLKVDENLFFVSFWPDLSRCNLKAEDFILFDAGATYAIDGHGRVLAVQ